MGSRKPKSPKNTLEGENGGLVGVLKKEQQPVQQQKQEPGEAAKKVRKKGKKGRKARTIVAPLKKASTQRTIDPAELQKLGRYTWQEVQKHNKVDDCWISVGNVVYDITDFVSEHPGGMDMIMLAAGRDATDLIRMYHPFTEQPYKTLLDHAIGKLVTKEHPAYKPDDGFYKTLRQRVKKYFRSNNIDSKAPRYGITLWIQQVVMMEVFWFLAYSNILSFPLSCVSMILCGICCALTNLHLMHDSSHTAVSKETPWVWRFFGEGTLDALLGGSFNSWLHQHIVGHHVYTNVMGADPDLPEKSIGDMRRVTVHQEWSDSYYLQWLWLPILYSLLSIKFRLQDITENYIKGMNGPVKINPYFRSWPKLALAGFFKAFWLARSTLFPRYFFGASWGQIALFMAIVDLSHGVWLAWNFQVSHISDKVRFLEPSKPGAKTLSTTWARAQVETSLEYGYKDRVMTYLAGALNHQAIHHLFPSVSQYHYPALFPIVRDTCKEFNVRFNYVPTFTDAWRSHVGQLWKMSLKDLAHLHLE